MKVILTNTLVTLGVVFVLLVLAGGYFYVTDPLDLKPMIFGSDAPQTKSNDTQTSASGGFQLSDAQKQALVSAGVDPSQVPSDITAAQETCFVHVLGDARVAELKSGAIPSGVEFLKAKSCI